MTFRKKPVTITAEQYLEGQPIPKGVCTCGLLVAGIPGGCQPHVHTMHDNQRVDLVFGDWVIPEPDGEHFYPCDAKVFAATYEPASESDRPRARFINEGTTLIIESEEQHMAIEVTDDNSELCEALAKQFPAI